MNNVERTLQITRLAESVHTVPTSPEFCAQLLAVLRDLFAAVEDIRARVARERKAFYTVEDLAHLTGRSAYTVRRWVSEGRIEATRVKGTGPNGRLLIAGSELTKLVDLGMVGGAHEPSI